MTIKLFGVGLILTLSIFYQTTCWAQIDYTWWDVKHNWVRGTHWHEYITISPGFMGPNALPVPEIKSGVASKRATFKFALERHSNKGDQTENLFTDLYLPLYSTKIGLHLYGVPIEQFRMDTLTRDIRKGRDISGKGFAAGDLYIGTYIQLLEDKEHYPDVLLTINLKTASGNKLSSARYTDAPAYFFDLSFGKTILLNGSILKSIRPHALVGFYVWQTYEDNRRQNDAVLYGFGVDFLSSYLEWTNAYGGYDGYLATGDKSFVFRSTLRSKFESIFNYGFQFQQGFYDFNYTSFRISTNIDLQMIKKKWNKNKNL